jgi:hypothetical protein
LEASLLLFVISIAEVAYTWAGQERPEFGWQAARVESAAFCSVLGRYAEAEVAISTANSAVKYLARYGTTTRA